MNARRVAQALRELAAALEDRAHEREGEPREVPEPEPLDDVTKARARKKLRSLGLR